MRAPQVQLDPYKQKLEQFTSNRQLVAAAAAGVGGIIVILLSLIAGVAKVDWLIRSGYGWISLLFYLLISPLGFAIYKEIKYSAHAAAILIIVEFVIEIIYSFGKYSVFPQWLIALKFILFLLVAQIAWPSSNDEEQPPQQPQQPMRPGPPVGRRVGPR
ncbi:MAG: hypothetical protein RBU37_18075 [Myxococcota bacterium]|jgi:hypothetical protein|nr:hypothetical protein [Myxococcota bacterium]